MFYFGRFRRDTLSPTKKREKIQSQQKRSHLFYTNINSLLYIITRIRVHHKSRIKVTSRTKISFLIRRDGRDGGQQMGAEENVFV